MESDKWVVCSTETMSTQPTAPARAHTRDALHKIHPVTRITGIFDNVSSRSRFKGTSRYTPGLHLRFLPALVAAKLPIARRSRRAGTQRDRGLDRRPHGSGAGAREEFGNWQPETPTSGAKRAPASTAAAAKRTQELAWRNYL